MTEISCSLVCIASTAPSPWHNQCAPAPNNHFMESGWWIYTARPLGRPQASCVPIALTRVELGEALKFASYSVSVLGNLRGCGKGYPTFLRTVLGETQVASKPSLLKDRDKMLCLKGMCEVYIGCSVTHFSWFFHPHGGRSLLSNTISWLFLKSWDFMAAHFWLHFIPIFVITEQSQMYSWVWISP